MNALLQRILNERAVICGALIALLQAVAAGQVTKETAVPVVAGIVLRFFVSPYHAPVGGGGWGA